MRQDGWHSVESDHLSTFPLVLLWKTAWSFPKKLKVGPYSTEGVRVGDPRPAGASLVVMSRDLGTRVKKPAPNC